MMMEAIGVKGETSLSDVSNMDNKASKRNDTCTSE